tara:strand:+ start:372 stop:689 length:318 start_codon:yes stop_codon:yes gene_type:complete
MRPGAAEGRRLCNQADLCKITIDQFPTGNGRRRVSLLDYKGDSGRILGSKLNKNDGKITIKKNLNEICQCLRKIKKWMWRKIQKKTKSKMMKIQKKYFEQNLNEN